MKIVTLIICGLVTANLADDDGPPVRRVSKINCPSSPIMIIKGSAIVACTIGDPISNGICCNCLTKNHAIHLETDRKSTIY